MRTKSIRVLSALVLILAAGAIGHIIGGARAAIETPNIPATTVAAPPPGSVRIIYGLDQKQNDKEIIALIERAKTHIYFAMYTFTLENIADALVAAKKRGIDVRGLVDSGQSRERFSAGALQTLLDANIPVVTEKHPTGNGIMHIKAIVTDSAYATGSYNWTKSATTLNDEILEIGTDETMRRAYETILKRLLDAYAGNSAAAQAAAPVSAHTYDYAEARKHIGEYASVRGRVVNVYTAKSGVTFLDFCAEYKTCPFTGVIFASDLNTFGDIARLKGVEVTLTGTIALYNDKAEIVLKNPSQIKK